MTWKAYRLVYRLQSPLHIGWRKIGNLMQTRPYIPGRTWWGAATSTLTQHLGKYNYPEVGDFVCENLIFSYFFLAKDTDSDILLPQWKEGKVYYGSLDSDKFERQFLKSQAATAIDAQSNTSLEGQLYEVEYITPYVDEGNEVKKVFAIGYLFAREGARIECQENEVLVDKQSLFHEVLQRVQIGGERRYGWGTLLLEKEHVCQSTEIFGYFCELDKSYPVLSISPQKPIPAHFLAEGTPSVQGELEPLVRREWHEAKGPGHKIPPSVPICWVPGTCADGDEIRAEVQPMGVLNYLRLI